MPTSPGKESISAPAVASDVTRQELPTACGNSPCWANSAVRRCRPATSDKSCSEPPNSARKALKLPSPRSWSICRTINGCWCAPASDGRRDDRPGVPRRRPGIPRRLRFPNRTNGHFQPSSGGNAVSNAEAPVGSRDQARDQRPDRTRRRRPSAVRRSRSRQPRTPANSMLRMPTSLPASPGLLGIAIERQHADADLREALDHQAMLTREMSHRVKNSLASVVGLLRVQSRNAQSEDVQNALKDAASRITTIAQVHDHLWRSTKIGFVDIADFAGELCRKLQETVSHTVRCNFGHLMISADKAIPLGLLINELVTNSAKHAYPDGSGEIRGVRRTARRRLACRGVGSGNRSSEGFRYRPAAGEPGLQGDQEPAGSTRWTHCSGLEQSKRRNRSA